MRAGMYPSNGKTEINETKVKNILNREIFKFLQNENVTILNEDGLLFYKKNCSNRKSFIFLDPPYLFSCNQFYKSTNTQIYEYLFNRDIRKENAVITLCLENNWIIKLLFKDFKIIIYDKKYELSKNNTTHMIVTNNIC
jgi:16S rRNA G966 N2-methylase RsmD